MKLLTQSRIVWSLIYGLVIIGNAMMFKGTRGGVWIDVSLTAGILCLVVLKPEPLAGAQEPENA